MAETFSEWLARAALAAGYDTAPRAGGRSKLAKAAGVDPSVVGKALDGLVIPNIPTQRLLCKVLRIRLSEMLLRSGTLQADDLPQIGDAAPPPAAELDLEAVAREFGIPPERRHLFVNSVRAVAKTFAEDPKGSTIG